MLAAALNSARSDARLLMILDPESSISSQVHVRRGPRTRSAPAEPGAGERRERDLENCSDRRVREVADDALRDAFAPSRRSISRSKAWKSSSTRKSLGARDMPAIAAQVTIKAPGGRVRRHRSLFRRRCCGPVSQSSRRAPPSGAAKFDPQWTRQMEYGVTQRESALTAILDEFEMTLGEVSRLASATCSPLRRRRGQVRIECAERGVFLCRLGERTIATRSRSRTSSRR